MGNKVDYLKVLEDRSWSLVCGSVSHGDDSGVIWEVVGYFMEPPFERVIGIADESKGPSVAIDNALETVTDSAYAYLYEYTK